MSFGKRIIKQEKMYQIKAKILFNKKIIPEHYKICLDAPEIAGEVKPGQFVHIRVREGYEPLLRRPFSIHKSQGGKIEILYKVVGKGTQLLSREKIGKKIDILGPLGQGFRINPLTSILSPKGRGDDENRESFSPHKRGKVSGSSSLPRKEAKVLGGSSLTSQLESSDRVNSGVEKIILVAGGIGVAPLYFLAERLVGCKNWATEKRSKEQPIANDSLANKNQLDVLVLLGAETKEKILCLKDFRNLNVKVEIATEDGSKGFKGLVGDLLSQLLSKESQVNLICACGPVLMLRKVAELSFEYKIPCQVSLEQKMGCGIGACLGCTIKGQTGYLRVCRDGPVFEARQIQWNELVSSISSYKNKNSLRNI